MFQLISSNFRANRKTVELSIKVFGFYFLLGKVWLTLAVSTWLTCGSSVSTLFSTLATNYCFCIIHLYNLKVATKKFWKQILALMSSCQLITTGTNGTRASSTHWLYEIDWWTPLLCPCFIRTFVRGVSFSCHLVPHI